MTIHEKLRRLARNMKLASISREAGLAVSYLHNTLKDNRLPSVDSAARIARTLGVDPGWLIDDTRGWPPTRTEENEPEPATAA